MSYPNLFSPIKLGSVEMPNRTVMAPINNGLLSTDETWPFQTIRYYEERAIGGIGLIITGAVRVSTLAGIPKVGIFHERFIPSHKKLVDRIHKYDTKIFCQLTLNGGKVGKEAPSAIYNPAYPCRPPELTTEQLDGLVEDFIRAAGYAREAGYDGVEIHGGHTYFVGQMMSPSTNKRTDKYGGSFEGRMKFPVDVLEGIAREYPGFAAGIKFSAYEELPGGIDIPLGIEIAKRLASLNPAYLHVSTTSTSLMIKSRWSSVPHMYITRNTLMPLAEKVKKACTGVPVMGTGGITVPEDAERFIAEGACDVVALGRTVLADPHWPNKAKEGKAKNITPCIRCNLCYYQLWSSEPLICTMNPYLSHENELHFTPADRRKTVMVVGAGPAGIRCALTAAKRGHDVTLYEKMPYIGGMVYPGGKPQFKDDLQRVLKWYETELAESTVTVKLSTEVTPELVEEEAPDVLVIAVGGDVIKPGIPGIDQPHVASAIDVLRDVSKYRGTKAAVIGGGEVGCEAACYLADNGFKEVTVIEMLPDLMPQSNKIILNHMELLLEDRNIKVMTGTPVTAITPEGIEVCLKSGKLWGIEADLVVYAVGIKTPGQQIVSSGPAMKVQPKSGLIPALSMKAEEVYVIGDCTCVARILEATAEGERIGRWV
ncbi:NAD(P)/FAD-dependent oxidoreductase [bacterium]|nr:NAD(P)/FAD-dependent oxidoreductase [bacterium]